MPVPDYTAFTKAVAESGSQPQAAFNALWQLTRDIVGVKLFTVMTHDGKKRVASRIFSNMPEAYPVSGTKAANPTDWSRQVIERKQIFVANDIEGIRAVFDDHELIRSLGCESVINVPIVVGGEVLGTINCLHEAGFYTSDKVAAAEALKLPGAVCLLLTLLDAKEGQ
jgi:GAF domain-containing protein